MLLNEKRRSFCLMEDDIKREKAVNELVDGFTLRTEWWSVLSGKIRQRHPTQQPRPAALRVPSKNAKTVQEHRCHDDPYGTRS